MDADKTWRGYFYEDRITVTPALRNGENVLRVLLHECCHAARPDADHDVRFGMVAASVGLKPPWTMALQTRKPHSQVLRRILRELGPYPPEDPERGD